MSSWTAGRRLRPTSVSRTTTEQRWRFKTAEEYEEETGFQAQAFTSIRLDDVPEIVAPGGQQDEILLVNLLKKMLLLDRDERITPAEVFQHPFLADDLPQSPLVTSREEASLTLRNTGDVSLESSRPPGAQSETKTESNHPEML